MLQNRLTGIFPCIKKSFILVELRYFLNPNLLLFSGLKILTKEETKYGAIKPF